MDADFLKQLQEMAEMEIPEKVSTDNTDGQSVMQTNIEASHQMPAYLKEQIINRTKQPDMQPVSSKRKRSKRMELFLYSCKVTAAVAASLVIIITLSATQGTIEELPHRNSSVTENLQPEISTTDDNKGNSEERAYSEQNKISEKISDSSRSITNWLQDFPGKIFD